MRARERVAETVMAADLKETYRRQAVFAQAK
jgi:hypothetical protein